MSGPRWAPWALRAGIACLAAGVGGLVGWAARALLDFVVAAADYEPDEDFQ